MEGQQQENQAENLGINPEDTHFLEEAKSKLALYFDGGEIEPRINDLINNLEVMPDDKIPFNKSEMISELKKSIKINEKQSFIRFVLTTMRPLFIFKRDNPGTFEEIARNRILGESGKEKLSDVLSFDFISEKGIARIHLAIAKEYIKQNGIITFMKAVVDGLNKLAGVIQGRQDIKKITATSWIVHEHPTLIQKLGFTLSKKIIDDIEDSQTDNKTAQMAWISRKDFLKKYGGRD